MSTSYPLQFNRVTALAYIEAHKGMPNLTPHQKERLKEAVAFLANGSLKDPN